MTLLDERRALQRKLKERRASRDVMRARNQEQRDHRRRLAEAVDRRHQDLRQAQDAGKPNTTLERALADAEAELAAADKQASQGRVHLQRLDAEVQNAEDEVAEFSRTRELAGAPSRFEELASRAYGFLAATSAAAIITAIQFEKPDVFAKTAIWLATGSVGIAFAIFLPTLISAVIDALRAHGKASEKGATSVSWAPAVLVIRLVGFVAMFGLATASWILILIHFGRR